MNLGYDEKVKIVKNKKIIIKKIKMKQPLHKNMFKDFIKRLIINNKKNRYEIKNNGLVNSNLIDQISNYSS